MKKPISVLACLFFSLCTALAATETAWTFRTDFSKGDESGGGFKGIIFTLAPGSDRYIATPGKEGATIKDGDEFSLTSIDIQLKDQEAVTALSTRGVAMFIMDANGEVLGISDTKKTTTTQTWGTEQIERMVSLKFSDVIITAGTTYYGYLANASQIIQLQAERASAEKSGTTFVIESTYFDTYTSEYQLAVQGNNSNPYASPATDFGLSNELKENADNQYVPVASISATATTSVPEPTTLALGILALSGIAWRRRR